ncbi:MAG: universal stress protein [Acidobacteriia bacterium]|nr:universal stress protein [Terriglobia bacterium]
MATINTVLCPLDFSDASRHALDHAIAIAGWYRAKLVALHTYHPVFLPVPGLAMAGAVDNSIPDADTVEQMTDDMAALLRPAKALGLATETRVQMGTPAAEILAAAASLNADMIVMGTHGTTGFDHAVLGSVTEKVLRTARCQVLTVPPHARATSKLPYKRLLCPVDFADPSLAALESALSLGQESDAHVTILHVLEWPTDEPLVNRPINVPEYGLYREQDANERLAKLVPDGAANWCSASTRLAHGKPYREILAIAAEESADLIVMGVHGRNAIDLMLFGSTTNQVVRRATCPVLTIRR